MPRRKVVQSHRVQHAIIHVRGGRGGQARDRLQTGRFELCRRQVDRTASVKQHGRVCVRVGVRNGGHRGAQGVPVQLNTRRVWKLG